MSENPSCFGSAAMCDPLEGCSTCKSLIPCHERAYETLRKLPVASSRLFQHETFRERFHLTVMPENVGRGVVKKKINLSDEEAAMLATMGPKPRQLAYQLLSSGIQMRTILKQGRNPFSEGVRPKFMSTVCQMLLESGFTKKALKERLLRDNQHWAERTADSHVTLIVSCLTTMGVISSDHYGNFSFRG